MEHVDRSVAFRGDEHEVDLAAVPRHDAADPVEESRRVLRDELEDGVGRGLFVVDAGSPAPPGPASGDGAAPSPSAAAAPRCPRGRRRPPAAAPRSAPGRPRCGRRSARRRRNGTCRGPGRSGWSSRCRAGCPSRRRRACRRCSRTGAACPGPRPPAPRRRRGDRAADGPRRGGGRGPGGHGGRSAPDRRWSGSGAESPRGRATARRRRGRTGRPLSRAASAASPAAMVLSP